MKKNMHIKAGVLILIGTLLIIIKQPDTNSIFNILTGLLLAYSTKSDLENRTIPNKASAAVFAIGLIYISINTTLVIPNFICFVITLLILLSAYFICKKQIGLGDVKILTALSLFLGPEKTLSLLFISTVFAGVYGLIGLLAKKLNKKTELPFMPFILIGYYYVILL